jgi:hypothetical protein
MKFALFQIHSLDFLIRHLATGRVFPAIQTAGHLESFGGRRASDQIYDRLIIPKLSSGYVEKVVTVSSGGWRVRVL